MQLFTWSQLKEFITETAQGRAAILEYEGDYSRGEAERLAAEELGMPLLDDRKD